MDKVEETDRYTVTVTFKEPTGLLPEFLAEREAMMLPRDIADKAGKQRLTTEMAIGTGPYKLIEHKVDQHLRLCGALTFLVGVAQRDYPLVQGVLLIIAAGDVSFARAGDLRYVGQGYELRVPFPSDRLDTTAMEHVFAAFHALHKTEYGHVFTHSPIEIVNVRLTGIGVMPKIVPPPVHTHGALDDALVKTAPWVFRGNGGWRGSPRHFINASGWLLG